MRSRIGLVIVILAVAIFFIVALQFLPVFKSVNGVFSFATNPVSRYLYRGINFLTRSASFILTSRKRMDEIKKLRQEVRILNTQVASLQRLTAENETLKKQLNFLQETKYPYLSASVIGKINQEGQTVLILDKGEKDGVKTSLAVIVDNGILVGKILKTEEQKSFVLISTANQSQIAATFVNQTSTTGLVRGEHNIRLKMELIPKDVVLNKDELVITSGLEPFLPRGLVIGKVDEIITQSSDLFQGAYLQSLYSVPDFRIVTILLPNE